MPSTLSTPAEFLLALESRTLDEPLPPEMQLQLGLLRERTGAEYALFTHVQRGYSSGGTKALISLMIPLAVVGGSLAPLHGLAGGSGAYKFARAYLVDLEAGQVIWEQDLKRGIGDIRDTDGAQRTARNLLKTMPLSSALAATP